VSDEGKIQAPTPDTSPAAVRQSLFDILVVEQLGKLLRLCDEADIRIAPVKGVVLARRLYATVSERPYRDLDLLIQRDDLPKMAVLVAERRWPVLYKSDEMGELNFSLGPVVVEVHGEFGRLDFSSLTNAGVLDRATYDSDTLPYPILRIDDIDHFLLLVLNVVKKSFTYANPHQPEDFRRLLRRLEGRWGTLIGRAYDARMLTALRNVCSWMAEQDPSGTFEQFSRLFPPSSRCSLDALVTLHRRSARRHQVPVKSASGLVGLAIATCMTDDRSLRTQGLMRLVRRGTARAFGVEPG
jgi:hypothetical protein